MTSVAQTIHQTRVPERFGLRVPLGATIMPGIQGLHSLGVLSWAGIVASCGRGSSPGGPLPGEAPSRGQGAASGSVQTH